jgi:hypothetical protein
MKVAVETTWRNVCLVFEYSAALVLVEVPIDEDKYDYNEITRAASKVLAADLGLSVSLVESYVQDVEVRD